MNCKRAITVNIVSYLATLLIGSAIVLTLGIELDPAVLPSPKLLLFSMILALVFTGLGAVWYFRSNGVKRGARQGFLFGVIAIIIGLMMDGVLFFIMLMSGGDPMQFFSAAYNHWFFVIMLLVALISTTIIGAQSEK